MELNEQDAAKMRKIESYTHPLFYVRIAAESR